MHSITFVRLSVRLPLGLCNCLHKHSLTIKSILTLFRLRINAPFLKYLKFFCVAYHLPLINGFFKVFFSFFTLKIFFVCVALFVCDRCRPKISGKQTLVHIPFGCEQRKSDFKHPKLKKKNRKKTFVFFIFSKLLSLWIGFSL